jgi:hypothetical protein
MGLRDPSSCYAWRGRSERGRRARGGCCEPAPSLDAVPRGRRRRLPSRWGQDGRRRGGLEDRGSGHFSGRRERHKFWAQRTRETEPEDGKLGRRRGYPVDLRQSSLIRRTLLTRRARCGNYADRCRRVASGRPRRTRHRAVPCAGTRTPSAAAGCCCFWGLDGHTTWPGQAYRCFEAVKGQRSDEVTNAITSLTCPARPAPPFQSPSRRVYPRAHRVKED